MCVWVCTFVHMYIPPSLRPSIYSVHACMHVYTHTAIFMYFCYSHSTSQTKFRKASLNHHEHIGSATHSQSASPAYKQQPTSTTIHKPPCHWRLHTITGRSICMYTCVCMYTCPCTHANIQYRQTDRQPGRRAGRLAQRQHVCMHSYRYMDTDMI